MKVLVVEDDASVSKFLTQAVSEAGYAATVCADGLEAAELAKSHDYDIVLLDVMLPNKSGIEVCKELRAEKIMTPILIITAKDATEDKVEGLDAGADDYIVKPFEISELMARMRALRRRDPAYSALLQVGDLTLDPHARLAIREGRNIYLSATEFNLLEYLMKNAGRVLSRSAILEHVWQYDFGGRDNVLDVYISYLRDKIDKPGSSSIIKTVRGTGYTMGGDEA